jgi:beta-galactosidase
LLRFAIRNNLATPADAGAAFVFNVPSTADDPMATGTRAIKRRDFLVTAGAGLAVLAWDEGLGRVAAADESSLRRVFPLNRGWLYSSRHDARGTLPEFDDRGFERVTVPHTNKVFPWHGFDDRDYQFISLYRRHFRLPADLRDRRIFVDFDGVMTAATVHLNGVRVGEHRGGYTPFSIELTPHLRWNADNVLAVEVDSTERPDIPPFGNRVDYLTFGGIYREVQLRAVPATFVEHVFARPVNVLQDGRRLDVRCVLAGAPDRLLVELLDGERVLAHQAVSPQSTAPDLDVSVGNLGPIDLWSPERPKLYTVRTSLFQRDRCVDRYDVRIGFRDARFTPDGFFLNGQRLTLRGLNRHQTFPYVGQAMPARVQRRDAWVLRKELKLNIVRTSHYPQSPHFLDACDELGLLVLEETPGWQHIGDAAWQDLCVRDVEAMVRRDRHHPSVVLWGVRINESRDDHDLYVRTNQAAHALDDSRQTGGIRNRYDSELLEDVFTMNDFQFPLRPPNHPLYLVTEFNGHMYPTKPADNVERITEHTVRHARVHNQIASDRRYAGGIGWCAFDYNTHAYFGSGDRVCYHGVADIFRIPKPAAGFYRSQCDPNEEVVLEPAFHWARGDHDESFTTAMVCSNCEHVKLYIDDRLVAELDPDRDQYGHLVHPPFVANIRRAFDRGPWGDLRIEGYIAGQRVATKTLSGNGVDREFHVDADDGVLAGDGIDATRVVLRVTDEFGAARPFSTAAIALTIDGPGDIIGENPFALAGGLGAVWIRTKEAAGAIRLTARHPVLGAKIVTIQVTPAPAVAV